MYALTQYVYHFSLSLNTKFFFFIFRSLQNVLQIWRLKFINIDLILSQQKVLKNRIRIWRPTIVFYDITQILIFKKKIA